MYSESKKKTRSEESRIAKTRNEKKTRDVSDTESNDSMLALSRHSTKHLTGYRASSPIVLSSDTGSECSMSSKKTKLSREDSHGSDVFVSMAWKLANAKEDATEDSDGSPAWMSNFTKWEQLEYDLSLCAELVESYVKLETYGIGFDKISLYRNDVKAEVCKGHISAQTGMTQFFDYLRGLLDVHVMIMRGRNDAWKFDISVLMEAMHAMDSIETETYSTGYYGMNDRSDEEDADKDNAVPDELLPEDEMELIRKAVYDIGGSIAEKKVGYVGGFEDFGDPEYSDMDDDDTDSMSSNDSMPALVSSYDFHDAKYGMYKAARVRTQQTELSKLLKRYNVGLTLLPELLQCKVQRLIMDGFDAIENRGYMAEDVMYDIAEEVGQLRTNADVRRLFLEATLVCDLDG